MKIIMLMLFIASTSLSTQVQSEKGKTKKYPHIQLEIEVDAPRREAFEYIVPIELSHIFKRYKNLPAIDSTSNQERWYTPGMQRTVYFEDGSTAQEYLLTVNPHADFSYNIDSFSSPLHHLAKRVEGKWVFTETEAGKTHILWTYTVVPKHFFARIMINAFVKKNLRGLLSQALQILKKDLETEPHSGS